MRSGADRNANVRLLVSDDGTVRCNRGKPVPMGAERLLTARELERDLETQAALGLELPKGRGADPLLPRAPRGGDDRVLGSLARAARLLQPPRRLHERRRQARLQARAMTEVGRVAALWRYPVKSMAAEALEEVEVSWHGLAGDRRWAFIRDGIPRSGFPWMTIRERSDMGRYRPSFLDPARPDASRTVVRTPGGAELEVVDPALAAELGDGVRVIKQDRGVFDTMPLSLDLDPDARRARRAGRPRARRPALPPQPADRRAADGAPFQEEAWVGAVLRIGGMRMRIDQRDERCVIVNVDPVTTERDPAVLRTLAREREACAGVYGSTVEPGRVAIGDPVSLDA